MLVAALCLLSLAVMLGAVLVIPRRASLTCIRRRTAAATHGALGASGLCVFLWIVGTGATTQAQWLVAGLLFAGLLAGLAIFATCRHARPPPALVLALHVVFAGMGYLLFVGLILS